MAVPYRHQYCIIIIMSHRTASNFKKTKKKKGENEFTKKISLHETSALFLLFSGAYEHSCWNQHRQILPFPAVQFGTNSPAESLIWKEKEGGREGRVEGGWGEDFRRRFDAQQTCQHTSTKLDLQSKASTFWLKTFVWKEGKQAWIGRFVAFGIWLCLFWNLKIWIITNRLLLHRCTKKQNNIYVLVLSTHKKTMLWALSLLTYS